VPKPRKPRKFIPSSASRSAGVDQVKSTLCYIKKAADLLERCIDAQGELPEWSLNQVNSAATFLGMAVTYTQKSKGSNSTLKGKSSEHEG
jgi:hypothetical protein